MSTETTEAEGEYRKPGDYASGPAALTHEPDDVPTEIVPAPPPKLEPEDTKPDKGEDPDWDKVKEQATTEEPTGEAS